MSEIDLSAWPPPLLPFWGLEVISYEFGGVWVRIIDLQTFERVTANLPEHYAHSGITLAGEQMTATATPYQDNGTKLWLEFLSTAPAPGDLLIVEEWHYSLRGLNGEWFAPQRLFLP